MEMISAKHSSIRIRIPRRCLRLIPRIPGITPAFRERSGHHLSKPEIRTSIVQILDINMAVRFQVVRNGEGSALCEGSEVIHDIVYKTQRERSGNR